ncbi:hypothetical protein SAMN05443582_102570 [Phyllobacterium sp. OV277]|nr:hypothetical protein SAMN05443582_102570 [Phyllobacterium sp. OV277]
MKRGAVRPFFVDSVARLLCVVFSWWFVVRGSWFVVRGSWFDKLTMRESEDATLITEIARKGCRI